MLRSLCNSPPLMLFHGLLSSPQEFGLISLWLRNNGVALEVPEIPGYTLATHDKKPDWRRWRDAAVKVLDASAGSDSPVIVGGLCMGGVLAAAAALECTRKIAGVVLLSPTFDYDGWGLPAIRHLRKLGYLTGLDRFFWVKEQEPYGVKSDKIRKWIVRELQEKATSAAGPSRIPLPALREGERMMAAVRTRLAELNCPLLVMHAREDEITTLASVQALFDPLPQTEKRLIVLENSYHMITIDNDRHQVASELKRFVDQLSAGPSASIALPSAA